MLGGKVYVGFLFAHQFHRLAVFVFAKLINTVTLRTKPKVIGNHCALTVIEIFISVKQRVCLPLLEKQSFGIRGVICRYILRSAFADEKKLARELVNRLIQRIEVQNNDKYDGHCHVKVDIYFTGVGIIDIPTEQEILKLMEDIRIRKTTEQSA